MWFRRIAFALLAFVVANGPWARAAGTPPCAFPIATMSEPSDMAMDQPTIGQGTPAAPCKGLTPDCVKRMGCVADVALPCQSIAIAVFAVAGKVDYWSVSPTLVDASREPEDLPPRTI